jgi:inosine-uridine preferring nucleoside hydrolase
MPVIEQGVRPRRPIRSAIAVIAATVFLFACSSDESGESDAQDGATSADASGPSVIIDTDLSLWWDDATAIGLANVLHQRDEIRLLGIVSDVPNTVAVAAIDAINTAYGHDDIPLGAVAGSDADTFEHGYTDKVVRRLPHSIDTSDDVPGAVALYRRLLAAEPDGSVTIVSLGGYTNLAGLLDSEPDEESSLAGRALVEQKVKRLVIMDGLFPEGIGPVTNQKLDLDAASAVVARDGWPTPIGWVDGFGGISTLVGGTLCTEAPSEHPMRVVYEALFDCEPPGDGNWDAPALLYAVGEIEDVFEELGQGGAAVINEDGGLSWKERSSREHDLYVHVVDQQTLNRRIDKLLVNDRGS